MAEANISVTESQFQCPICLDILKDPAAIPCGHTYCMVCINRYWDQADVGHYSCPQCRDTFSPRPVLRKNTVLAEVVEKLKLTELVKASAPDRYLGGLGDVACDFCPIDLKLKAIKSCLACLASYCQIHVAPHREVGTLRRHKLVNAIESLAERLCSQHRMGLEGGGDSQGGRTGDCPLCESDQEDLRNADAQRARRQAQLLECQSAVQGRIRAGERELGDFQQALDSLKVYEVLEPMTLTSGKGIPKKQDGRVLELEEDEEIHGEKEVLQMPRVQKGGQTQVVPWSFMDMVELAGQLPDLTEGAGKWITALEESTRGTRLALGDIKALLMHVAGKHVTREVFMATGLDRVASGHTADHVGFGGYRPRVWAELRRQYPEKMDPSKLEGEELKEGESVQKFLHTFQRRWREETGSPWNANATTQILFKLMIKYSLPQPVQKRLEGVVGLTKMEWPLFSEYVTHHVEQYRKEKKDADEQNKQPTSKVAQLQLGELSKAKKDKEKDKGRTQAPVVLAESPVPNSTVVTPVAVATPQSQTPQSQTPIPAESVLVTPTAITAWQIPPIHVYVNQSGGGYRPPMGRRRGRGRLGQRGGMPQRGGGRGPPGQLPNYPNQGPQPSDGQRREKVCWGCNEVEHQRRDCPTNPWAGPPPPSHGQD